MAKQSIPKYKDLDLALKGTSLKLHPSQVHGLICGILCGTESNDAAWNELLTGQEASEELLDLLQQLYQVSAKQLDEFLFELQLILPKDSAPLVERAEALTLWCQGFLTGLKVVSIPIVDREPSEETEAINDLIEIANMNYEEVVSNEEDEAAFVELVEYIRMAVILIYQDLHAVKTVNSKTGSVDHLH